MTSHIQTIRPHHETELFATVVDGIKYLHRGLARWMRPERRRVAYQPLGVPVSLGIALLLGAFAGPALSADAITADTAGNYRKIAISRFKEMKDVREKFKELKAQGYVDYAEPTLTLLSLSCASRDQICRPYYLVTQGWTLRKQTTFPQVTVVGAVISPTTHFGSEDRLVAADKMAQLPALLKGAE